MNPICNNQFPERKKENINAETNFYFSSSHSSLARLSLLIALGVDQLPCSTGCSDTFFAGHEAVVVLAGIDGLVVGEEKELVDSCSKGSTEDRSEP